MLIVGDKLAAYVKLAVELVEQRSLRLIGPSALSQKWL